jgi:hypothetical protein
LDLEGGVMPNELIRHAVLQCIHGAVGNAMGPVASVDHAVLKGRFREFLASQVFAGLLPSYLSIGKGLIVDRTGQQSGETDLIIYDKNDMAPIFYGGVEGIFPVECCRYVFEVKSLLTREEVRKTINNFRRIRSLMTLNTLPILTLIGYQTDLSGPGEFERYISLDLDYATNPAANVLCAIGKGYWYFGVDQSGNAQPTFRWNVIHSDGAYLELLGLISGILNTLNPRSQIGHYLLPDHRVAFAFVKDAARGIEITVDRAAEYNRFLDLESTGSIEDAYTSLVNAIPDKSMLLRLLTAFAAERLPENLRSFYAAKLAAVGST